jgi:hypothetical protein
MKIGYEFESVLKRGLLEYAAKLPSGSPEFRYVYHEVIEEAQHSLMFHEFVNRTGFDIKGLAWWQRIGARRSSASRGRSRSCSSCSCSAARIRSTTCSGRCCGAGAGAPAAEAHHADPRHRRGAPPLLRAPLPASGTRQDGGFRRFLMSRRAPFILAVMAQLMMRPVVQIVGPTAFPPR